MVSLKNTLNSCKDLNEIKRIAAGIDQKDIQITWYGSRRFKHRNFEGSVSYNDFLAAILKNADKNKSNPELRNAFSALNDLDQIANNKLQTNWLAKKLHFIPHFLGSLFFNRKKALVSLNKVIKNIKTRSDLDSSKDKKKKGLGTETGSTSPDEDSTKVVTPPPRIRRRRPPPPPPKETGPELNILDEIDYNEERAADELDFNFLYNDDLITPIIMDTKLLFHIHAGKFGSDSPLEGSPKQFPLSFLVQYLKDQNKILNSPRLAGLVERLNEALEIELSGNFEKIAKDKIEEAFRLQRTLLIPGGWAGEPAGHAIYYEVRPIDDQKAIFRKFDLGATVGTQNKEITSTKERYVPYQDIETSREKLTDQYVLKAMKELKTRVSLPISFTTKTLYDEGDINKGLFSLLKIDSEEKVEKSPIKTGNAAAPRPMSSQDAGVCAFRSAMAFIATNLSRREYKKVKCDLKIKSLRMRHRAFLKGEEFTAEDRALMAKSIKRTSKSVHELAKQKIVPVSYVKASVDTLQEIDQWVQSQPKTETVKSEVKPAWRGVEASSIDLDGGSIIEKVKTYSDKTRTENLGSYGVAEELKKLTAEQNKEKAISKALDLAKEGFKHREYVGLQAGLEEFILSLPIGEGFWKKEISKDKAKEYITKIGDLGQIYFNTCFYTPGTESVSAEKHAVMHKITNLHEYLLTNLYEAKEKVNLKTEDTKPFQIFTHQKFQVGVEWSHYTYKSTPLPIEVIIDKYITDHEGLRAQEFDKKREQDFNELFSKDPECWSRFQKYIPGTVKFKDYMDFYASEVLPDWLKAVRNMRYANDFLHHGDIESLRGSGRPPKFVFRAEVQKGGEEIKLISTLEETQNVKRAVHPYNRFSSSRYLFTLRTFKDPKAFEFLSYLNSHIHEQEKDWLTYEPNKEHLGMDYEEFEELRRIFGPDKNNAIETLEYFTKYSHKLKDPDYQIYFLIAFFNEKLKAGLDDYPNLSEKAHQFLLRSYHQMNQTDEIQPAVFLLQCIRHLEDISKVKSEVSLFDELKILLNRKGITIDEKSVIYTEMIAHLNGKREPLKDEELELLLTGMAFREKYPVPQNLRDPYQEAACRSAPHNLASQIKAHVLKDSFQRESIHRILKVVCPDDEKNYNWFLDNSNETPIYRSGKNMYSPLQGVLFLESELKVERPILQSILEDRDFSTLFPEIKKGKQLTPDIYSFNDQFGRETLVKYDNITKKVLIQQNFEGTWRNFVPESSLMVTKINWETREETYHSKIISRSLVNNYSTWVDPKDPQKDLHLVDPKTGDIEYVCADTLDGLVVLRKKDRSVLSVASKLFSDFEDASYTHEWYEVDRSGRKKLKEIELPRFGLTFDSDLNCREFPGFRFKPREELSILGNYKRYLVLENDRGEKKVIVARQRFIAPNEPNPLIPLYNVDMGLRLSNKDPQKYFTYDLNPKGILNSSSKEANLYAAQLFTLVQEYALASQFLRSYGPKLNAYTAEEKELLKTISNMNRITSDEDPEARGLRTYASYLLIKNTLETSKNTETALKDMFSLIDPAYGNIKGYLRGLKGITALKLSKEEEIYLLKTLLDSNFDPLLFLRLKELTPDANVFIQKNSKPPKQFTEDSIQLPDKLDAVLFEKIKRANLSDALLTSFDKEVKLKFYDYYNLMKTANDQEKAWLKKAFEFNRHKNNPSLNFLELVMLNPDSFEVIPTVDYNNFRTLLAFDEWKKNQAEIAKSLLGKKSLNTFTSQPEVIYRGKKVAPQEVKTPLAISFEKNRTVQDPFLKASGFFTSEEEKREPTLFDMAKKKLNSWKIDDGSVNDLLDRLMTDVESLRKEPIRTRFELNHSLAEVEALLTPPPGQNPKEELKNLELKILTLANRTPDQKDEEHYLKDQLERMSGVKRPITIEQLLINFGRQDAHYLQELNSALTVEDLGKLYGQIYDYLLLATQEQRRERSWNLLNKLKALEEGFDPDVGDELIQELANELSGKRSFNPQEIPLYLSFEYFLNIMIRKDQKINTDTFLNTPNAVMEMIMGTGKTSVLLQLIGYYHADSHNLSLLIVPEPLFEQVANPTQKIHQDAFGRELVTLKFSRGSSFSRHSLETILDKVQSATKNQQCLIMTNKSIACLILKYVESCIKQPDDQPRSEELKLMDKLIFELSSTGYPLMDEIDTLLNILHEVSFSFGDLVPVDESEYVTIATLYKIIYQDKEIKQMAYVESDPNPNEKAPILTHEIYHKNVKNKLAKAFIKKIGAMKFNSNLMQKKVQDYARSLDDTSKSLLESYLTQDEKKISEAQKYYDELDPDLKNMVALASEEISRFLPFTLTINSNEKYGFDDEGGLFAIPYAAANKPNKGSDFKNSHVTMNGTFQLYIKNNIPSGILENVIERLKTKALKEMKDNPQLDIEKTEAWKTFSKIKGPVDISLLKYNLEQLNELNTYVNKDIDGKIAFIIDGVLPFLKRYAQTSSFNPQNVVDFFDKVSGFTGTLWNTSTMLKKKINIRSALGTDAKTILTLFAKCKKNSVFTFKGSSMKEMLDEMGPDFDALIDAGGYFKEGGSAKAARLIARQTGVPTSFYSKSGFKKITDGHKKYPYTDQKRKVLIDQSRATGTDEKLPPNAKGIVTISRNMLLRDLLQAVWRLRGIEKKQSVSFWISAEVDSIIRPVCGKGPKDPLEFEDILKFAIYNQAKQLGQDNFKALKQQFLNIPQMIVLRAMMGGNLTENEQVEATKLLKMLWVKPANLSPSKLYGKLAVEKDSKKALQEEKEQATKLIKLCFEKLPSFQDFTLEECLKDLDAIEASLKDLLPPKLKNKDIDDDQNVEMEVEMEQMQETEVEVEEMRELHKPKLGLKNIHTFNRIIDFDDQKEYRNYFSLELFLQNDPRYEIFAGAFEGIDMVINVLQFPSTQDIGWEPADKLIPYEDLSLFGRFRTPLHHVGIREDGTVMILSKSDLRNFKNRNTNENMKLYNLTLGPIEDMKISPKTFERIVKIKFLNGESNYSKKELEILREWIGKEEVATEMREFFMGHILNGLPQKRTEYNTGSDLKKLFHELEIEQASLDLSS